MKMSAVKPGNAYDCEIDYDKNNYKITNVLLKCIFK
jgi:hypothetical protein